MNTQCPSCLSCGMPLENKQDSKRGIDGKLYCIYCLNPDGSLKSFEEILKGSANHLAESQGLNPDSALAVAGKLLKNLPYWKDQMKGSK